MASGQLTTLICALAVNSVGPAFSIGSSFWTLRRSLRSFLTCSYSPRSSTAATKTPIFNFAATRVLLAYGLRRKCSRDFDRPTPDRPSAQKAIGLTVLVPKSIFVFPIDQENLASVHLADKQFITGS